ncbi:phage tail tube protein [Zavarzinia compransoris]|uniref:Phage tail protein n=1 Tax=Zavarzinia compransoris TaxID=1264899 RepID=A0A317EDB6_9PROT|nr:phage tail tube protein [Zavarzinia compransoris]PWR23353.1 hypothetical protein DKG75_01945 [Zavarzinia compransoris]TDP46073.1 hypothetical protein DES42_104154 [Zavarzinia compransoris]
MFQFKNKLLLLKPETVYGTDPTPTAAVDAFETEELSIQIMSQKVERNIDAGVDGNMGFLPVGAHVQVSFKVALAGSGVAGTAPAYAAALLACRMTEVITAATSAVYTPAAGTGSSAGLYFYHGGWRLKVLGWRGSWKVSGSALGLPMLEFTGLGLWGGRADTALPSTTLPSFIQPWEISKANTAVTLHGVPLNTKQFTVDCGLSPKYRNLTEQEVITSFTRKAVGSLQFDAVTLATKDWQATAAARTRDALSIVHGTTTGNIVTIAAPKVQVEMPTWSNDDDVLSESLNLVLCPTTGNDELSLSFT